MRPTTRTLKHSLIRKWQTQINRQSIKDEKRIFQSAFLEALCFFVCSKGHIKGEFELKIYNEIKNL